MVLCIVDMILGVIAAKRTSKAITSKGFGRTLVKIAVYETAICTGFLVQKYLINDLVPVVSIMGAMIGLTELKSVLENLDAISGDKFFKVLIDRLASQSDKQAK
jgi:hypothetical protein